MVVSTLLDKKSWLRVALPVPVRKFFDYQMPNVPLRRGQRVKVPFRRSELIGIAVASSEESAAPLKSILPVKEVLEEGVVSGELMDLLLWAARYYQHPPGEALTLALPPELRRAQPKKRRQQNEWLVQYWRLAAKAAPEQVKQHVRQYAALQLLAKSEAVQGVNLGVPATVLQSLAGKGWIESHTPTLEKPSPLTSLPQLSDEQTLAAKAVIAAADRFQCLLLEGITGSGKTEVYMAAIAHYLCAKAQVLMLVPEISLAAEMHRRLQVRFPGRSAVIHSGLSSAQRRNQWLAAAAGDVDILLGTRAALLTPMPRLGLIIVDEEQDSAYKQQSGFCYSARDLAIKRAANLSVPVLLGSATPSLESLMNVERGLYKTMLLKKRPRALQLPHIQLVDLRSLSRKTLFSGSVMASMNLHLDRGGQVLVFANRRGIAPALFCTACRWTFDCSQCDARMVIHQQQFALCHHCGRKTALPKQCLACHQDKLIELGAGTQKFEDCLKRSFSSYEILRFDTDISADRRFQMLQSAQNGQRQILVGTQMLAKGYDFPNLTLTVITDADAGFFAADFRSVEKMAQLVVQVSGRAGRHQPGEVLIQTRYPEHPMLKTLLTDGYHTFAEQMLAERRAACLPPYAYLAMFKSEAKSAEKARQQLLAAADAARGVANMGAVEVWGPAPMLVKRKAGVFRQQLMLCAAKRSDLRAVVEVVIAHLESKRSQARWFVEVDPLEAG